ncbi:MAG: hypothetical protein ACI4UX_03760 [Clostridia bacterium]
MSKFIIIVYVFVTAIFVFGCNVNENICENNIMQNTIAKKQIIGITEIKENEISNNISNEIAKEYITKEEAIDKSSNIVQDSQFKKSNTKPINKPMEQEVAKVEKGEKITINPVEKPIQSENNSSQTIQEDKEQVKEDIPQKNGYYYNESESNFLVSEFKRLTNYDSNFTVRISKSAKSSNPFYPYRESEINKKVYNATFGYFIVYAEDYYKDDIKQRTLYYITFDN